VISTSTALRRFLSVTAALIIIQIIIQLAMNNLREALAAGEKNQKRLEDTNRLLAETQAVLEKRVDERTAALEQRAGQLQAAVEVATAVTSIRDLDALLDEVTGLIAARFGYYHVGIYLPDENNQALALRSASSQIGRELIGQDFRLPLDEVSMATTTARTRQARVAADVRMDEQYRPLDALSLTQSEITLPLISGDKLMGVLDLQDVQVSAPSSEELTTLRLLANQTAIAIDNALLLASSRQSLESLQRAYGTLSREGWQKVLRSQAELGFRATAGGQTLPAGGEWAPEMAQAQAGGEIVRADPQTLAVPIKIREQVAGVVRLCKPDEAGPWRSDEIALVQTLSDRLSAALEGARLYEETRRRAERERLTGEITARLRASNDPQTILEVAARELRKALQADKAQLVVQAAPVVAKNTVAPAGADGRRDGGRNGHGER
jgi:GAF domain-containing protein